MKYEQSGAVQGYSYSPRLFMQGRDMPDTNIVRADLKTEWDAADFAFWHNLNQQPEVTPVWLRGQIREMGVVDTVFGVVLVYMHDSMEGNEDLQAPRL